MNETELMKQAIYKWGRESQLDMVVEECAELIKAIQKYRRNNETNPIVEESVDVELMLEQLKIIFPEPELRANIRTEKLARLQKHLESPPSKAQADLEAQWAELEYQNDCAQQQNNMNEECRELPF